MTWDSDEYDRQILAERRQAQQLVGLTRHGRRKDVADGRGQASDEELTRRKAAARAIARSGTPTPERLSQARKAARARRPGTVRWPQPRPKPNGRWLATCVHNGRLYSKTFDTREEAEQFIRQVKEGK